MSTVSGEGRSRLGRPSAGSKPEKNAPIMFAMSLPGFTNSQALVSMAINERSRSGRSTARRMLIAPPIE